MLRVLRRVSPRNPFLAAILWVGVVLAVLVGLFFAFFYLDRFLPGSGMF